MCVEYNQEISIPFKNFVVFKDPEIKYVRILQELSYGRRNFAKNAFNIAIHCM